MMMTSESIEQDTVDGPQNLRQPHGHVPGWASVHIGLGMIYWSLLVICPSAAIVLSLVFTTMVQGMSTFQAAVVTILGVLSAGVGVVYLIGECLCFAAPAADVRKAVGISLILLGGVLVLGAALALMIRLVIANDGRAPRFADTIMIATYFALLLAMIASHAFFVLGIRRMARHFGDKALVKSTGAYLIALILVGWSALAVVLIFYLLRLVRKVRGVIATAIRT
jgi:hypothetical protein